MLFNARTTQERTTIMEGSQGLLAYLFEKHLGKISFLPIIQPAWKAVSALKKYPPVRCNTVSGLSLYPVLKKKKVVIWGHILLLQTWEIFSPVYHLQSPWLPIYVFLHTPCFYNKDIKPVLKFWSYEKLSCLLLHIRQKFCCGTFANGFRLKN